MKFLFSKRFQMHAVAWFIFILFFGASIVNQAGNPSEAYSSGTFIVIFLVLVFAMAAVYSALYYHERWFSKRNYLVYGILMIATPVALSFLFSIASKAVGITFHQSLIQDIFNFLIIMNVAVGLRYVKRGTINQFRLQQAESRLLRSELDTLKSQINPHFLFNTLNNIYGVNLKDSEKGSEMILSLAELFRYFLDAQKKERVPFKDELEFIRNYVELEKVRLSPGNRIELKVSVEDQESEVPPLLLMPLVENAVKYGVHPGKDAVIEIHIEKTNEHLTVSTTNKHAPGKQVVSTGSGLENLRRRLALLYADRFELNSSLQDEIWSAKLQIKL
ncbi:MAG: histidine kinase [Balneolales bacterium]|nr:histidine kinase [Balneolales bacterium]